MFKTLKVSNYKKTPAAIFDNFLKTKITTLTLIFSNLLIWPNFFHYNHHWSSTDLIKKN